MDRRNILILQWKIEAIRRIYCIVGNDLMEGIYRKYEIGRLSNDLHCRILSIY